MNLLPTRVRTPAEAHKSPQIEPDTQIFRGDTVKVAAGSLGSGHIHLPCNGCSVNLDSEALERHLLFLGSIGSGKTNAIFHVLSELRREMTEKDVMIVFDTKGDYVQEFYQKGDAVIANREDDNYRYVRWNVFRDISFKAPKNIAEPINEVSRTLYDEVLKKSKEIFFPYAARDLTTAVLIALLRKFSDREPTNSDVRRYLYGSSIEELHSLITDFDIESDLKGALQYIDLKTPQTQGVMSTIKIMVQDLFTGSFGEPGDFSVRQFVSEKRGRALFIEYDIDSGRTLLPIYRVLFDLAIKEALSRKRSEGNVYFVIDEFALLPNLYHIDNGVNFGRSLGAKFVVGAQNVAQVNEAYGKGRGSSILSSFGTVFAFRLYDQISRGFVSNRYGLNRQKVSLIQSGVGTRAVSEQIVNGKVIEDWHISSLEVGESILSMRNGPPYIIRFSKYPEKRIASAG